MKKKYGGNLIHRGEDEYGPLEVIDDGFYRSLHFGTEPRQSSMDIYNPARLALSYTRAMTTSLLFLQSTPRRVLILGLGAGSLATFLFHNYPECHIDAVELRQSVVQLAYEYFQLPEDPRLRVIVDDAGRFIRAASLDEGHYDLVLLDAYEANGMSHSVVGISFFCSCRSLLTPDGVLAANLWSGDRLPFEDTVKEIAESFDGRAFQLPVGGKENVIVISPNAPVGTPVRRRLKAAARDLEALLDVEYPALLRSLKKNNPGQL